jgi:flavin reductase (DIM6/NTAB) family NADH-FMN oxidoreductase RutF
MNAIPLHKVYRYFEPRPVILLNTKDGSRPNTMTASLYNTLSESGPVIAVNLGPWDRTLAILEETKEAVISIPTASLLEETVQIGNSTGIDKFKEFHLNTAKATKVKAPLIPNALANFEALYEPDEGIEAYGMYALRIVAAWEGKPKDRRTIRHNGDGTFTLTGETVDLKRLMTRYPSYTDD